MPVLPQFNSQLDSANANNRMARVGGAASRGSTKINSDVGQAWSAMEAKLLSGNDSEPTNAKAKALTGNKKPSRQFTTQAAGAGRVSKLVKSPAAFSARTDTKSNIPAGPKVGGNAFSAMEKPAAAKSGTSRLFGGSVRKLK